MHYTLHQLHVFLKVVQHKSITVAAYELHMSQPAVSIQLRNFQDQFEIPLTEVIGRQLYVTEFGNEIAEIAERVLAEVQAINTKTSFYKGKLAGRLKISSVSTGKYVMPYFLNDFLHANPEVELKLDVTNKNAALESLKNNDADFALISVLPPDLELQEEILLDNHLYLVANKQSKLKKITDKATLQSLPLIFREHGSATRQAMEQFFEKKKIGNTNRLELTSNEAVKQAVIAGLGYSIMPLIGIRNELQRKDLHLVEVSGLPIKTKWRLVWLKNKNLGPLPLAYLNYLRSTKEQIQEKYFKHSARGER